MRGASFKLVSSLFAPSHPPHLPDTFWTLLSDTGVGTVVIRLFGGGLERDTLILRMAPQSLEP